MFVFLHLKKFSLFISFKFQKIVVVLVIRVTIKKDFFSFFLSYHWYITSTEMFNLRTHFYLFTLNKFINFSIILKLLIKVIVLFLLLIPILTGIKKFCVLLIQKIFSKTLVF